MSIKRHPLALAIAVCVLASTATAQWSYWNSWNYGSNCYSPCSNWQPPSCTPCTVLSTTTDLGSSCGNPAPRFSVTAPKRGSDAILCIDSNFPGGGSGSMEGHVIVLASVPIPTPYPIYPSNFPGFGDCTVYVDLVNLNYAAEGTTDAQGDWCGFFPILNDPSLVGVVINLQARVWSEGGPFEAGDHLSNGVQVRIGCDNSTGNGRTPGYWKQCQHFFAWRAPYTPSTPFSSVFDNAFPGKSLLQVLQTGGGGVNALGRHTVAALLNAADPTKNYPLTTAQVITLFNGAVPGPASGIEALKNYFQGNNEAGG